MNMKTRQSKKTYRLAIDAYLELVRRVNHGLLFECAGTGTQLAVFRIVETHAAIVVADLRNDHGHIGRTPPRLRHVLFLK